MHRSFKFNLCYIFLISSNINGQFNHKSYKFNLYYTFLIYKVTNKNSTKSPKPQIQFILYFFDI